MALLTDGQAQANLASALFAMRLFQMGIMFEVIHRRLHVRNVSKIRLRCQGLFWREVQTLLLTHVVRWTLCGPNRKA